MLRSNSFDRQEQRNDQIAIFTYFLIDSGTYDHPQKRIKWINNRLEGFRSVHDTKFIIQKRATFPKAVKASSESQWTTRLLFKT